MILGVESIGSIRLMLSSLSDPLYETTLPLRQMRHASVARLSFAYFPSLSSSLSLPSRPGMRSLHSPGMIPYPLLFSDWLLIFTTVTEGGQLLSGESWNLLRRIEKSTVKGPSLIHLVQPPLNFDLSECPRLRKKTLRDFSKVLLTSNRQTSSTFFLAIACQNVFMFESINEYVTLMSCSLS